MDILWFLLVGLIAGWIAGLVMRGRGFGMIGDIVVGIVGAVIGGMVFRMLGLSAYGTFGAIAMAAIGAIVLLSIIKVLKQA